MTEPGQGWVGTLGNRHAAPLSLLGEVMGNTTIKGLVIGAVAGALLPVVSWPLGLAAGAGFALYQRLKK